MDLSKLYLEKSHDSQTQKDTERIIADWANGISSIIGQHEECKCKNIKSLETPAYYFRFTFQLAEKTFYNDEKPYTGKENIPQHAKVLEEFGFKDGSLPDIPVEETYNDNNRFFPNSQILYLCPTCKGKAKKTCSVCSGEGTVPCSRCKSSPEKGYIKCTRCNGEGKLSDGSKCRDCRNGWQTCPQCGRTSHPGIITCKTCNGSGSVVCGRCNGSGKVVQYVAFKQTITPLKDFKYYKCWWHTAIPNELKVLLTGGQADFKLNARMLFAYSEAESIEDSEDKPNEVFNVFNTIQMNSLYDKYKELFDEVSEDYEINNDFSKGVDSFTTKRITKVKTQIFKINISHITYEYNSKNYELWLYGNNNELFTLDNPFIEFAEQKEKIASEFIEKKKYTHAIKPLEEACKIADKSCNHKVFNRYAELLKKAREKSDREYLIGLLIGLGIIVFSYLLQFLPSSDYLCSLLNIKSEKAAGILTKITGIFIGIIIPVFFADVVFAKIIYDKLKHKIVRILSSAVLPVIYVLTLKMCTYLTVYTDQILFIGSTVVFFICLILACVIKIPYQKYKMTTYTKPKWADKYENKRTAKEITVKCTSSNEVSPKRRILALVLSLFLGFLGGHNFYAGKVVHGIIQLGLFSSGMYLFPATGGFGNFSVKEIIGIICMDIAGIWVIADFIRILFGKFRDKHKRRIKNWW